MVHAAHVPRPADGPAVARVGFVVSKAVGNSVVRSRTVRVLRHVIASHLAELPGDLDLVVRAQPAIAGINSERVDEELQRHLHRALSRARSG